VIDNKRAFVPFSIYETGIQWSMLKVGALASNCRTWFIRSLRATNGVVNSNTWPLKNIVGRAFQLSRIRCGTNLAPDRDPAIETNALDSSMLALS